MGVREHTMLKLFELGPSPNNTKVRMALGYKGIPFEVVPVDPRDRSTVRAVSGQDLTPVIEDRGVVLPDSEAILHYLDANYRDTPRLFPADRNGRKVCDAFKQRLDDDVVPHWAPVFFHAIGVRADLDTAAAKHFEQALLKLQDELGDRESFAGEDAASCDLRVAEWATYALPSGGLMRRVPVFARTKELFGADPSRFTRLSAFLTRWNGFLE